MERSPLVMTFGLVGIGLGGLLAVVLIYPQLQKFLLGGICVGALLLLTLGLVKWMADWIGRRPQKARPEHRFADSRAAPDVGTTVVCHRKVGKYGLVELLGQGGFGQVHKAVELENPKSFWALKELHLASLTPERRVELEEFFQRERRMLSWLSHPSIVRWRESFHCDDSLFLVLEFIPGFNLGQVIEAYEGPVPQKAVMGIVLQVCDILGYLHAQKPRPIIFRDLKPGNLMLEGSRVKLIDFGISRLYDDTPVEEQSEEWNPLTDREAVTTFLGRAGDTTCLGTPGYAAPEQYPGSNVQTDLRADIYSLGALMHHMLTGIRPPAGRQPLKPIGSLAGSLPRELEETVDRCLAARREDRFTSTRAIQQQLMQLVEKKLHLKRSDLDDAVRVAFERTRKFIGREAALITGTSILSISLAEEPRSGRL